MGTRLSFNRIERIPEVDKTYPFSICKFDDLIEELVWWKKALAFDKNKENPEVFQFSATSNIIWCFMDWVKEKGYGESFDEIGVPFGMWFSEDDLINFIKFSGDWKRWERGEREFIFTTLNYLQSTMDYKTHHLVITYS